ncbi:hypothetical protein OJAV_G00155890 [Oryzias javanicus]|uniref:Uncharacterized protein n=1 Tax=Oryzias javanicus TaxID=123683 RepID=A0A3S2MM82_ORYJA|nr:hypothetical protein OJAV_G00155890 [Oryzias javanicus]
MTTAGGGARRDAGSSRTASLTVERSLHSLDRVQRPLPLSLIFLPTVLQEPVDCAQPNAPEPTNQAT